MEKGVTYSPIKISNISEGNNERSIRPLQISYKSSVEWWVELDHK